MKQIHAIMLMAFGVLVIIDLIVGVSNDAVNFLNSALGSKAVSFKTTMSITIRSVSVSDAFYRYDGKYPKWYFFSSCKINVF